MGAYRFDKVYGLQFRTQRRINYQPSGVGTRIVKHKSYSRPHSNEDVLEVDVEKMQIAFVETGWGNR